MADQDPEGLTYVYLSMPPQPRRGPGAVAWVSLGMFAVAVAALALAFVMGAYGSALISFFGVLVLSLPTLILMAVWIEVRLGHRRATRRVEAESSSITPFR